MHASDPVTGYLASGHDQPWSADEAIDFLRAALVFTTRSGRPIEPRNLARSFHRICEQNQLKVIKVHHLRHTTASLLKKLRVAPRDAQMILGHAHISTTMQVYTHVDEEARDDALANLNQLLGGDR